MPDRDEPPPIEPGTATFRRLCDAECFLDRLENAAAVVATVEVVGECAFVVRWPA